MSKAVRWENKNLKGGLAEKKCRALHLEGKCNPWRTPLRVDTGQMLIYIIRFYGFKGNDKYEKKGIYGAPVPVFRCRDANTT